VKKILRQIRKRTKPLGFDPIMFLNSLRGLPFYFKNLSVIKKQKGNNTEFIFGKKFPILTERFESSGTMNGHYFHQDLLVARKIFNNKPIRHVDIGSRTDGFVAHVAVFREIEVMDIRNQIINVKNIIFKQADLMNLPDNMVEYADSISALHSIEHFGLGRYGDPIDYYGHIKGLNNIYKMLKQGGRFYFSVPIGKQRIEYNAHRVFSVNYLLNLFKNNYVIDSFSYVDDHGDLFEDCALTQNNINNNFSCKYGCGIFEMTKV
jgi:SAM-dependent methyltransferase